MKIVIVGGGLTGLYIGYMLKNINMDFDIYEKSIRPGGKLKSVKQFNTMLECGDNFIQPYHYNTINLLNKLKIKAEVVNGCKLISLNNKIDEKQLNNILMKILNQYNQDKPTDISTLVYFQSVLPINEYNMLRSYLFDDKILQTEISGFMQYSFYDIKLSNKQIPSPNQCIPTKYIKVTDGMQLITDKLAEYVQENLYLDHFVQEITYMPLTGTYLVMINNAYIQADKIILATNASIGNIRLNIPHDILRSIRNVKSIETIKIFTLHKSKVTDVIKPNNIIQTQSILSHITPVSDRILTMSYIYGTRSELLYSLLSEKSEHSNTKILEILNHLIKNITGLNIPDVEDYLYCHWDHGYHINKKQIRTNFWHNYNMILAGEWVHPYHNTIEGACLSAKKAFKIMTSQMFVDKLIHKPDNVKSIEENRSK